MTKKQTIQILKRCLRNGPFYAICTFYIFFCLFVVLAWFEPARSEFLSKEEWSLLFRINFEAVFCVCICVPVGKRFLKSFPVYAYLIILIPCLFRTMRMMYTFR